MADEAPASAPASSTTASPEGAGADPKASTSPSAAPPVGSAGASTGEGSKESKPFNVDEFVRQNLRETNSLKKREAEVETRRKEVEASRAALDAARPVLELLPKVDQARVVKALGSLAAGDRTSAVLALADLTPQDVLELADSIEAAQAARPQKPVEEIVKEQLAAAKKAEEDAAKDADAKKKEEAEAGFQEELDAYTKHVGAQLRDKAELREKFPLCAKMAKWLPVASLKAEVTRRANAGESVLFDDVLGHFEKQFAADGITVAAPAAATAAPVDESFNARFARRREDYFKEPAETAPASVPIPQVPRGTGVTREPPSEMERIYAELRVMDDAESRARY